LLRPCDPENCAIGRSADFPALQVRGQPLGELELRAPLAFSRLALAVAVMARVLQQRMPTTCP
jgi:hypothetical protein